MADKTLFIDGSVSKMDASGDCTANKKVSKTCLSGGKQSRADMRKHGRPVTQRDSGEHSISCEQRTDTLTSASRLTATGAR